MLERRATWKGNPVGFVIMRDERTRAFQEAYYCDARDAQAIANTIRNLRAWHPGGHVVDLTEINKKRKAMGFLYEVREGVPRGWLVYTILQENQIPTVPEGKYATRNVHGALKGWLHILPAPTGVAPPSEDPNAHAEEEELVAVT